MTTTRSHTHAVDLALSPERAFALLVTPSDIRAWWSASRVIVIPKPGGTWSATWGDDEDAPDYITSATLEVFDPPHQLVLMNYQYAAKAGELPFDADFRTTFTVDKTPSGSRISVTQDGFPTSPESDDYYAACSTGWHQTFEQMKAYVDGFRRGV